MKSRKNILSRIVCVILAAVVVISMLTVSAYASEADVWFTSEETIQEIPMEESTWEPETPVAEIPAAEIPNEDVSEPELPAENDSGDSSEEYIQPETEEIITPAETVEETTAATEESSADTSQNESAADVEKTVPDKETKNKETKSTKESDKKQKTTEKESESETNEKEEIKEKEQITRDATVKITSAQIRSTTADISACKTQRAILDAAGNTVPSPAGYCAQWVNSVYAAAGFSISGNACDLWAAYCSSNNRDDLQPGMLIAVKKSSTDPSADGYTYGHIGIYLGNGMVADCHTTKYIEETDTQIITNEAGTLSVWTLDAWIASYDPYGTAAWGYPESVQKRIDKELILEKILQMIQKTAADASKFCQ